MRKNARVLSLCLLLALVLSLGMPAAFADDAAAGAAAPAGAEEQVPENGTPKAAVPATPTEPDKDVQPTVTKPVDTLAAPTADGARAACWHWDYDYTYKITKEATCGNYGYKVKVCSNCGETYGALVPIEPTGNHIYEWTSGAKFGQIDEYHHQVCIVCNHTQNYQRHTDMLITDVAVDATCTQPGHSAGKYCPLCNYDTRTMYPALGHTVVVDEAVAPTCTETGLTEGSHCSVCGDVLVKQTVIPAKGHNYGDWQVTKAATCTEDGSKERICSVCNDIETAVIPATGHTPVTDAAVLATCGTDGKTEGSHCSVCGIVLVEQKVISATGNHTYPEQKTDDWNDETHTYTCAVCGTSVTENHKLGPQLIDKAPTCTDPGSYKQDCVICNYSEDHVIKATGHKEETIPGKDATCTETGLTEGKKCSVCGKTLVEQEVIPALGHKPATENGKVPTCEVAGTTDRDVCARCGEVLREAEVIPATGHDWGDWIDNGDGTHTRICKNDSSHMEPPEKHHVVEFAAVPATCTTPGFSAGKWCSECHAMIAAPQIIPATGHVWGDWVNTGDGKTHVHVCKNDPSHTEYQRHQMGPWEVVKHNTETTDGYMQRWCQADNCDYHETRVIKAGVPKTGDSSNILLYSGLCLAAVCGTAGVLVYVKRKKAE